MKKQINNGSEHNKILLGKSLQIQNRNSYHEMKASPALSHTVKNATRILSPKKEKRNANKKSSIRLM